MTLVELYGAMVDLQVQINAVAAKVARVRDLVNEFGIDAEMEALNGFELYRRLIEDGVDENDPEVLGAKVRRDAALKLAHVEHAYRLFQIDELAAAPARALQ